MPVYQRYIAATPPSVVPGGGLILVTEELSDGDYLVTVEDHGIGMTPEQVEKVFDKFYRVDASDTGIEGAGLGMTIVKHLVEAHKGEITVESVYGKGTTVRFAISMDTKGK
jgi:signal transduction histidine kinase